MTTLLNKYEVRFEGEMMGVYYAATPENAKKQCLNELRALSSGDRRAALGGRYTK